MSWVGMSFNSIIIGDGYAKKSVTGLCLRTKRNILLYISWSYLISHWAPSFLKAAKRISYHGSTNIFPNTQSRDYWDFFVFNPIAQWTNYIKFCFAPWWCKLNSALFQIQRWALHFKNLASIKIRDHQAIWKGQICTSL